MLSTMNDGDYQSYQIGSRGEFGLKDSGGAICLLLMFSAKLYNLNLNGTNIASQLPSMTSPKTKLDGHCAVNDSKQNDIEFRVNWKKDGRKKLLKLRFITAHIKTLVNQIEELRWQLKIVSYTETYAGKSISFASDDVVISAPLKQKYICRDKVNISLSNDNFKDIILEMAPEINILPYYVPSREPSLYVCERTRRRTLAESFESRMTIFSGVVLCIASVSTIVGYSFRRHHHPSRQHFYESLR